MKTEVDRLKTVAVKLKRKAVAASQPQSKGVTVSKGAKGAPASIENPHVVVDVTYPDGDYLSLPVNFLRKDTNGKG